MNEVKIFQVKRIEARSNEYRQGESYLELDHLGFFSTVEKAFDFIDDRVSKNYGYYHEYCICKIILDNFDVKTLWDEERRKNESKVGDTNG